MANNCFYTMKVVAKNENAINRLLSVMRYEDNEFFIYRCNSAYLTSMHKEGEFFVGMVGGDVAWSCYRWITDNENKNEKLCTGYITGKGGIRVSQYGPAHYAPLTVVCRNLNIGIEIFSQEAGIGFQEHYIIDHRGAVVVNEEENWLQDWWDDDNDCEREEPIETGGFSYYGNFNDASSIIEGKDIL